MNEFNSLEDAIKSACGEQAVIDRSMPVSGGDINEAYLLKLTDGSKLFVKMNRRENMDFFRAESSGLEAIAETKAIKTPHVFGYGSEGDKSFLLMSYLDGKKRNRDFFDTFGHNLAKMHKAKVTGLVEDGCFGFYQDNYIGAGFQKNTAKGTWIEFFAECRLRPQFERAGRYFSKTDISNIEYFLEHLDKYLIEPQHPSLLHGDLWGGNFIVGDDGEAWLIDPAVYVGHAEADIAMTELFGGFDLRFYSAYNEENPLEPGYSDRREIYNLYHLLNHLNLFGGGYLMSVKSVLDRFLKEF